MVLLSFVSYSFNSKVKILLWTSVREHCANIRWPLDKLQFSNKFTWQVVEEEFKTTTGSTAILFDSVWAVVIFQIKKWHGAVMISFASNMTLVWVEALVIQIPALWIRKENIWLPNSQTLVFYFEFSLTLSKMLLVFGMIWKPELPGNLNCLT